MIRRRSRPVFGTVLVCSICGMPARYYQHECCKEPFYACPVHGQVPLRKRTVVGRR